MSLAIGKGRPKNVNEMMTLKYGAYVIMALFLITIATAVSFHNFLHLPPAAGMMLGLGFLGIYSYHIKMHEGRSESYDFILGARGAETIDSLSMVFSSEKPLDQTMDTWDDAMFAIDTDHVITHWNKAMEEMTGIPAAEAVGTQKQWMKFYAERRPTWPDLVLNFLPEKMIEAQYEKNYRKNPHIEDAYDVSTYFPHLGDEGKWITFTAAPLKNKAARWSVQWRCFRISASRKKMSAISIL